MERERVKSILESLLFAVEGSLTIQRLAQILGETEKKEIQKALDEIREEFENQGRGFRLTEVAGGYQLRTPKENADWVKKLYQGKNARMSRATLETLAIVAYRQPITKAEIEKIRGVDVDGVLGALLERRLVRIVARKEVPGRPFLYGTTREFLEVFNLRDLSHLPTLKEMEELSESTLPEGASSGESREEPES